MTEVEDVRDDLGPVSKRPKLNDTEVDPELDELVDSAKSLKFGISERINPNFKRFSGLVKNASGDFIVNEIDTSGNVVRLTNFEIPQVAVKAVESSEAPAAEDRETAVNRMAKIIGDEQVFRNLMADLEANDQSKNIRFLAPKDKNERKEVHDFIKMFYSQYNSNTTSEGGIQQIEINHCRSNRRLARDGFKKDSPQISNKDKLNITECSLYKDSIDTLQAVNLIARGLKLNQKRIGYAGTKDKKAKTTQLISFFW